MHFHYCINYKLFFFLINNVCYTWQPYSLFPVVGAHDVTDAQTRSGWVLVWVSGRQQGEKLSSWEDFTRKQSEKNMLLSK